jgi:hypothetical protein
MTGYEQGPEYGGPEPSWRGDLFLILLCAMLVSAFVYATLQVASAMAGL